MTAKEKKRIVEKRRQAKESRITPKYIKRKPVDIKKKSVNVKSKKCVSDNDVQVNNSKKSDNPSTPTMKSKVMRDKNGRILPGSKGNGGGRPKGSFNGVKANELRAAVTKVELERRKPVKKRKFDTWLEHQINKSYDDTSLATTIFNKTYPTLKSIEQTTFDGDSVGDQEAESIRKELQERCKTLLQSAERKIKL